MKKIKPLTDIYKILLEAINTKHFKTTRSVILTLYESKQINIEEMVTLDRDYFYNKTDVETAKEFLLRRIKELK